MKLTLTVAALLIVPSLLRAGEGLRTNFVESTNWPEPVTRREWNTYRDGKKILTRIELDPAGKGAWSHIDQIIIIDGKPVLHFLTLEGRRSVIYHPEAQLQVVHADPNADGLLDRITLLDSKQRTVDIVVVDKSGRVSPLSDEDLAKWQEQMRDVSEAMKDF